MPITSIVRVSTAADGTQGNGGSFGPAFSPDGTRVAFYGYPDNFVSGDTNGWTDVFVKDLASGTVTRVSTAASGAQGNGGSYYPVFSPVFSPDGTKVAFSSEASNLVAGDTNGSYLDIFVKTLATGAISLVSTAADGTQGNSGSFGPVFSPDGTKVAYRSAASNLVPNDTNDAPDVFLKNLATGTIELISTAADGTQGNGWSWDPAFSPDGKKVAFYSDASNLVPGDTNGASDSFIKTLATGAIARISTNAAGVQGNDGSGLPVFSPDATKVAFSSGASNLVPGDTNNAGDIFVKTLTTGAIERVSTDAAGSQANGSSNAPVFSPDGTKVAFHSDASNLVAGDTNDRYDIFVKTLATGTIERISTDAAGVQGDGDSYNQVFSSDGTKVTFFSNASNLVPGDTNGAADIFVATLATPPATIFHDITDNTNRSQFKAVYAGDDSIDGTSGADRIRGWAGRDTILGEGGNDEIRGDGVGLPYDPDLPDTDPVKFADSILAGAGNDSVWGGGGNDTLLGEDGSDRLYGQGGGDSIDGGRGVDEINGGENNDTCRGGADNDWIAGGPGLDSLYGDDGNDKIYAFAPDSEASRWGWIDDGTGDRIEGGNGNDTLIGGKGIDTLTGGAGRDSMSGSSGDDIFRYGAASETGNSLTICDVITDFVPGHDKIDLHDIDASSVLAGNNAFVWRGTGPFTTSGEGELRYQKYDNAGTANDYTVIFGDTDADTASEFQIKLQGLVTLSQADFILTAPASPPGLIGYAETKVGSAVALDVEGQYAYVGTSGWGNPLYGGNWFQVFDISDPSAPVARGSYYAGQEIHDIDVVGNYAYVANFGNGLVKLDVSDPNAPSFVASRNDGAYANSFDTGGGWDSYVGYFNHTGAPELQVYNNAAFPSAPIASFDAAGDRSVESIDIVGDRAYLLASNHGPYFEVVNISDPLHPTQVSKIVLSFGSEAPNPTQGRGHFEAVGDYAYLAGTDTALFTYPSYDGGLLVIDLTDEAKPVLAAFVSIPDAGTFTYIGPGLDVVEDKVYMASQNGLYIFDVSNPADPKIIINPNSDPAFRYPAEFLPSQGGWVEVQGDLAFVTSCWNNDAGGEKGGLAIFQLPAEDGADSNLVANAAAGDWLIA